MKKVSSGIILSTPDGWLICHATGGKHWDFPKGIVEEGETNYQAALRELKEETSFVFDDQHPSVTVHDLGQHPYTSSKDLHLYKVCLPNPIDSKLLECTSMVVSRYNPTYTFPEADAFEFKRPLEAYPMLAKIMQRWIDAYIPHHLS